MTGVSLTLLRAQTVPGAGLTQSTEINDEHRAHFAPLLDSQGRRQPSPDNIVPWKTYTQVSGSCLEHLPLQQFHLVGSLHCRRSPSESLHQRFCGPLCFSYACGPVFWRARLLCRCSGASQDWWATSSRCCQGAWGPESFEHRSCAAEVTLRKREDWHHCWILKGSLEKRTRGAL